MSEINSIGVVGAGFMGSGIAESAARTGVSVVVHEPTDRALERSRERIAESVSRAVERSKLSEAEAAELKELPFAVVHAPELSFDLDTPDDIAQLLEWRRASQTRQACAEMGLAERLNLRTP